MCKDDISILVELNQIKYTIEDALFLRDDSLKNINTSITLKSYDSAVGWGAIFITLIIAKAFEKITEGFFTELGVSLCNWSKNKLSKITNDKEDFDESRINIEFKDCKFIIACNNKEDLLYATENLLDILKSDIKDATECPKDSNLKIIHINRKNDI